MINFCLFGCNGHHVVPKTIKGKFYVAKIIDTLTHVKCMRSDMVITNALNTYACGQHNGVV